MRAVPGTVAAETDFARFLTQLWSPDRAEVGLGPGSYLGSAMENIMLRSAIRDGMTNENLLANLVFFKRHPERNGRLISREGDGAAFGTLSQEWLRIRDTQVRPLLAGVAPGGEAPGGPGAPGGPVRGGPAPGGGPRIGQTVAMPRVTAFRFSAADGTTSDPTNCCTICPVSLGVGRDGTASHGMELRFTLEGHRPGMEYDITRTRRDSLWQRRAGVWASLGSNPMGTRDDHHDDDECLTPRDGKYIFAVDRPGWPTVALPAAGVVLGGGTLWPGVVVAGDAQDIVARYSFAEWVIARHRGEGIPWTPLELPPMRDGTTRKFVFWRCTVWLIRDAAGALVLDRPRNSIALGSLSSRVISSAP
jgi:hypothetical protein